MILLFLFRRSVWRGRARKLFPLRRVIRNGFNSFGNPGKARGNHICLISSFIVRTLKRSTNRTLFCTMPALSGEEALKFAQKVWTVLKGGSGFERILQQVSITSAGNGSCTAEFLVEEGLTNKFGTLHGGCTATLVDVISTVGLMTTGDQTPGVSVNLSVNYQSAAKLGMKVEIDSKTVKWGKTLAYLDITLKEKDTGKVFATGSHIKYVGK